MGKPTRPTESYRDDPDALSLHTTPDDYNYDDAPELSGLPPSYDDSASSSAAPLINPGPYERHHGHHLRLYQPDTTLAPYKRMDHETTQFLTMGKPQVHETVDLMHSVSDADPEFLEQGVRMFANEPPNPYIYIIGSHKETTRNSDGKKEVKDKQDFRIVISMQDYLWQGDFNAVFLGTVPREMRLSTVSNGEKTYRGSFMKKRAPGFKQDIEVGEEAPSLKEWCHRYCASAWKMRVFRIRRTVLGFDETYMKSRLEGLIRSTEYRGHINITFPVEDKYVDIYTSTRINEWRLKKWVCWIFYLTFLWIFTWPYLYFATKWYSVVKAEWIFSEVTPAGTKKYATISEEEWFRRWHVGIRRLVLDRFVGEAEYEQLQGVIARPADPPIPGTIATGNTNVDNAVGLLQTGFRVARVLSGGDRLGSALQTGWGYDN